MRKIRICCVFCTLFSISFYHAQSIEISGKVIVDDEDIDGIHVINQTASKFTITNSQGYFTIPATLHDTIVFSAIKFKPKQIIVNTDIIKSRFVNVYLTELVNQLDQVVVGKVLTGNLLSDIKNSDAKRDINFYDIGIPGYTGKLATQSERRLKEASGQEIVFGGSAGTGGVGLNFNPIVNAITGRTKMLKNRVKIESRELCLSSIIDNLAETFFENHTLDEHLRMEFFYFCSEDAEFSTLCTSRNDIQTLEFLTTKLASYKANLQIKKE